MIHGVLSWVHEYGSILVGLDRVGDPPITVTVPAGSYHGYFVDGDGEPQESSVLFTVLSAIAADLGVAPTTYAYVRADGLIRWRVTIPPPSGTTWVGTGTWAGASLAEWGILSATDGFSLDGDDLVYECVGGVLSAWWGGGRPISRYQPDETHSVQVSSSPYVSGATTHQYQGSRETLALRWLLVHEVYVYRMRRSSPLWSSEPGYPQGDDPSGILQTWLDAAARGQDQILTVDGYPPRTVRYLASDPSISQIVSTAASSGQRVDVEMTVLDVGEVDL